MTNLLKGTLGLSQVVRAGGRAAGDSLAGHARSDTRGVFGADRVTFTRVDLRRPDRRGLVRTPMYALPGEEADTNSGPFSGGSQSRPALRAAAKREAA